MGGDQYCWDVPEHGNNNNIYSSTGNIKEQHFVSLPRDRRFDQQGSFLRSSILLDSIWDL